MTENDNSKKRGTRKTAASVSLGPGPTITGAGGCLCLARWLQGQAHHGEVEPAAELGADLAGGADELEAEPPMERD
jgi:hypothetical protein